MAPNHYASPREFVRNTMTCRNMLSLLVVILVACSGSEGDDDSPSVAGPTPTPTTAVTPTPEVPTPTPVDPPVMGEVPLPSGQENAPYLAHLTAEGPGPLSFEVVGGQLPWGLSLGLDGTLSGSPTFRGDFSFTARVRGPGGEDQASFGVSITGWNQLQRLDCGAEISVDMSTSARDDTLQFDLDRPGATRYFYIPLSPTQSEIQLETVSADGADVVLLVGRSGWFAGNDVLYAYPWREDHPGDERARLTDKTPYYPLQNYREQGFIPFVVAATTPGTTLVRAHCLEGVAIGSSFLPTAMVGREYHARVTATGTEPFLFSSDDLPAGLVIGADTGEITGVMESAGSYTPHITVVDAAGASTSLALPLQVLQAARLTCGDKLGGSFEAPAFDEEEGLATEGAVFPFEVEVGEGVSRVRVIATRLEEDLARIGLWQGLPGEVPGGFSFGSYWRSSQSEGGVAWLEIGVEELPRLNPYGGLLPYSLAAVRGSGAWELEVECEEELRVETRWLANASAGVPYQAQLRARGGEGEGVWSLVGGELPPGLALSAQGELTGTPNQAGVYVPSFRVDDGEESDQIALRMVVGDGECGTAIPLECGAFEAFTLTGTAWHNRVTPDFSDDEAVDYFCIRPEEGVEVITLTLTPISGSNPDMFLGAPGLPPGHDRAMDYPRAQAYDDIDVMTLENNRWPTLSDFGEDPVAIAVAAWTPGTYTLEMECD